MTLKVFIIAGEPSGDKLGAALLKNLQSLTSLQIEGVGGPLMQAEGLQSLYPMDDLTAMGLVEILPKYRFFVRRIDETAKAVVAAKPDGEVYRACLSNLSVAPENALAIEDSGPGLQAATAAGVACIVTPGVNTVNHDYAGALTVVSHLGDAGNPYRWLGGRQPGTVEVIELEPWCNAA